MAYNTDLVELEMQACVLCEFLCNWIQLTAVHYIHLYFLTNKTVQKQTKSVLCSKFPKTSIVSEQFHMFKTRIIIELTVCCKIHKDFFFIERRYFIKT